jgi:hypothetical protein
VTTDPSTDGAAGTELAVSLSRVASLPSPPPTKAKATAAMPSAMTRIAPWRCRFDLAMCAAIRV